MTVLNAKTCEEMLKICIGTVEQLFEHKNVNNFLPSNLNICFGCSKEPSQGDCSFEYPQHMFWLRNKKVIFSYAHLSGGLDLPGIWFCSSE